MNYFGHVVVASWLSSDPAVALGSMLPDFANMCRGRLRRAHDTKVASGIELHHRTDKVFHTLEPFNILERDTARRLQARGVNRGGAMATAHVGTELLLDGLLLDDGKACELYLAAISCDAASTRAENQRIEWKQPEQADRWDALRTRLQGYGVPEGYRDPEQVAGWVALILRSHPTLALDRDEAAVVRDEMPALRERVAASMQAIMDGLRVAFAPQASP